MLCLLWTGTQVCGGNPSHAPACFVVIWVSFVARSSDKFSSSWLFWSHDWGLILQGLDFFFNDRANWSFCLEPHVLQGISVYSSFCGQVWVSLPLKEFVLHQCLFIFDVSVLTFLFKLLHMLHSHRLFSCITVNVILKADTRSLILQAHKMVLFASIYRCVSMHYLSN